MYRHLQHKKQLLGQNYFTDGEVKAQVTGKYSTVAVRQGVLDPNGVAQEISHYSHVSKTDMDLNDRWSTWMRQIPLKI